MNFDTDIKVTNNRCETTYSLKTSWNNFEILYNEVIKLYNYNNENMFLALIFKDFELEDTSYY